MSQGFACAKPFFASRTTSARDQNGFEEQARIRQDFEFVEVRECSYRNDAFELWIGRGGIVLLDRRREFLCGL